MNLCANDYYLARYFDQIDREESREAATDARASELFRREYRHDNLSAVLEALSEAGEETASDIDAALKTGNAALIGQLILNASTSYWFAFSLRKAEEQIDEGCQRCFGRGCRQCECNEDEGD